MKSGPAMLGLLLVALVPAPARADPPVTSPDQVFQQAASALERGSFEEAIDSLEGLSDQGFVHPDASYNRALGYVERARSPQARAGDLGRAVAALSEVLVLRPDDRDAELAVERVRAEIGRRRVREGKRPMMARPSLPRAIVGLASESVWLGLAAVGSLLATVGLGLRVASRSTVRLAGGISMSVGLLALVLGVTLGVLAGHYRRDSAPAVVVVPETRLKDAEGRPLSRESAAASSTELPEGAPVFLLERRGSLSRIEWGTRQGWVPSHEIRVLERP